MFCQGFLKIKKENSIWLYTKKIVPLPAISNNTVTSNKKNMNRVVFVAFLFLLFGCSSKTTHLADNVIAKAFDKTLTQRDITPILEQAKDSPDSVKFIENYLKKWAIDEILYKEAADYYTAKIGRASCRERV